jgi:hypothetical protein
MLFLLRNRIKAQPTVLVTLSVCFLAGMLPYAYLPIAASLHPKPGSWGQVDTFSGFMHHILRKDYGTFQLFSGEQGKTAEGFAARNEAFLADFVGIQTGLTDAKTWNAYGTVCLLLVVVGMVVGAARAQWSSSGSGGGSGGRPGSAAAAKKVIDAKVNTKQQAQLTKGNITTTVPTSPANPSASASTCTSSVESEEEHANFLREGSFTPLVLVFTLVFYFGVFHSLSNLPLRDRLLYGVHQRFWMQPNILMFLFLGVGVNSIFDTLTGWVERLFSTRVGKASPTTVPNSKGGKSSIFVTSAAAAGASGGASDTSPPPTAPLPAAGKLVRLLSVVVAVGAVLLQVRTWYPMMDMSKNTHFRDYARAVLSPLPQNAVLLINYDQQWTSVRYLQVPIFIPHFLFILDFCPLYQSEKLISLRRFLGVYVPVHQVYFCMCVSCVGSLDIGV